MADDAEPAYRPIACDFHDDLEAHAVLRRRVRIAHRDPAASAADAAPLQSEGLIRDLFTAPSKEEFMRLDDGTLIRLDRILSVEPAA